MKGKITKIVVVALIIIVLLIPIIMDATTNKVLTTIEYSDIDKTVSETANYGFKLVYVAPSSKETINVSKKEVKDTVGSFNSVADEKPLTAVYVDYDALSSSEKTEIFEEAATDTAYMFLVNGEIIDTVTGQLSTTDLSKYVQAFSANGINNDLTNYKVPENAKEFEKLVDRKKTVTMAVFGRDSCFYCNQFKVVYNTVAKEENIDVYYFDSDTYSEDEYKKMMDLKLKIPAECSGAKDSDGKNIPADLITLDETTKKVKLSFGTPLTLFIQDGKVKDCIDGYYNKANLLTKLKTVGMIKSEEK